MSKIERTKSEDDFKRGKAISLVGAGSLVATPRSMWTGRRKLYHGTTEQGKKGIMSEGLLPAGPKRKSLNTSILKNYTSNKKDVKEALSRVYATPYKHWAEAYSKQTQGGGVVNPDYQKIIDAKPHVVEMEVPVWQKRYENPEEKIMHAYNGVSKERIRAETGYAKAYDKVDAKYIKGSKKYRPFYKDLGTYAKKAPGRFAGALAIGTAGLAATGFGIKKMIDSRMKKEALLEEVYRSSFNDELEKISAALSENTSIGLNVSHAITKARSPAGLALRLLPTTIGAVSGAMRKTPTKEEMKKLDSRGPSNILLTGWGVSEHRAARRAKYNASLKKGNKK